jgi:hypothetical protein
VIVMSFSMSSHVIGIETVAIGFGFPNMGVSGRTMHLVIVNQDTTIRTLVGSIFRGNEVGCQDCSSKAIVLATAHTSFARDRCDGYVGVQSS